MASSYPQYSTNPYTSQPPLLTVMHPQQDIPEHSRLFVKCSSCTTKESLETAFAAHGLVEHIKMVQDRTTGDFKGIAFVKFSKASSAALALEALNNEPLDGEKLIVNFAEPKGARLPPVTDPAELPPHSRLFVTGPKDMTAEGLQALFGAFGAVEDVRLLHDKATDEPRGIAYVKFDKASAAALAVEHVMREAAASSADRPVRCRVAEPRGTPTTHHLPYSSYPVFHPYQAEATYYAPSPSLPVMYTPSREPAGPVSAAQRRVDNNTPEGSRLFISFAKPMPAAQLRAIFMWYGPLESVYLVKGKNYGFAKYATAEAAQNALYHLNERLVEGVACRVTIAEPQRPRTDTD